MATYDTTTLGYPRVGSGRPYKTALESFWAKKIDEDDFLSQMRQREEDCLRVQTEHGVELVPVGDFSFYDHVLDTAVALGCIPNRFSWDGGKVSLELYFALARGGFNQPAVDMTKWMNTNYHYMVPELPKRFRFTESQARNQLRPTVGTAKPWLLGPFTFLRLAKLHGRELALRLQELVPLYQQILTQQHSGAEMVQIDEPALVTDLTEEELVALIQCYQALGEVHPALCLQTYFGHLKGVWSQLLDLPVAAIGVDMVAGLGPNRQALLQLPFPQDKKLVLGVVDGRNVWRSDLEAKKQLVEEIAAVVDPEKLLLAPSCSLLYLPETVQGETQFPEEVRGGLCFAQERLSELRLLATALRLGVDKVKEQWESAKQARVSWLNYPGRHRPEVRSRCRSLRDEDFRRAPLPLRRELQKGRLNLPILPTTTIGSFPQTPALRRARARATQNPEVYRQIIRDEVARVIALQERIGLDVLVHGEPERNDMVQFFADQLPGCLSLKEGWVQSFGSQCVRPPVIFGDVWRRQPLTLELARYAQSLTTKPVKGMLTDPNTMIEWSFVREDIPRWEVAFQLALAIRDETVDLEEAGIAIIQIDAPGFREGLPLRQEDWEQYLAWAGQAFRLASSGVKPQTQLHSHMCYAEVGDILPAIVDLDIDVLSIEDARSQGEMIEVLGEQGYPAAVGPGVWDIHSPQVPTVAFMVTKLRRTLDHLEVGQVWVDPDCGLKTRTEEGVVETSLENMVTATKELRDQLNK